MELQCWLMGGGDVGPAVEEELAGKNWCGWQNVVGSRQRRKAAGLSLPREGSKETADVDGEDLEETQRGPIPGSGDRRRERRPGRGALSPGTRAPTGLIVRIPRHP